MKSFMAALALSAVALTPVMAACPGATSAVFGTRHPVTASRLGSKVFFRVSDLSLDFDGSPDAYGVRDQGQEDICNGLAPSNGACRGKDTGPCASVCRQTFAAWSRAGGDLKTLGDSMCSIGLAGDSCSWPTVRLQPPPNQAFFVSETSLKVSPRQGSADRAWRDSQAAQLDPAQIHYLVIPGDLVSRFGVRFGDVGIAINSADGAPVAFVVGDGGALGEGSVSLLARLNPGAPPRLTAKPNALGIDTPKYRSGVSGDYRFVIFAGSASLAAGHRNVVTLNADALQAWVDHKANDLFAKTSSPAELLACSIR